MTLCELCNIWKRERTGESARRDAGAKRKPDENVAPRDFVVQSTSEWGVIRRCSSVSHSVIGVRNWWKDVVSCTCRPADDIDTPKQPTNEATLFCFCDSTSDIVRSRLDYTYRTVFKNKCRLTPAPLRIGLFFFLHTRQLRTLQTPITVFLCWLLWEKKFIPSAVPAFTMDLWLQKQIPRFCGNSEDNLLSWELQKSECLAGNKIVPSAWNVSGFLFPFPKNAPKYPLALRTCNAPEPKQDTNDEISEFIYIETNENEKPHRCFKTNCTISNQTITKAK